MVKLIQPDFKMTQRSQLWVQLAIALASGVLMGCTPAPVNAWFLAWVALAPLWAIVRIRSLGDSSTGIAAKKPDSLVAANWQQAIALILPPLLWGIGYHGLALSWITGLHPLTWMGIPWLASVAIVSFCWLFITLWGAAIAVIWATIMTVIHRWLVRDSAPLPYLYVLVGTAIWCGLEALWSHGALWWTALAYTQSPYNLAILHLGQVSGPTAVTGAIVAVNGLIAEAWIAFNLSYQPSKGRKLLVQMAVLLIGLHLWGWGLYSRPLAQPTDTAIRVGLIQGNIPTRIKLFGDGLRRSLESYTRGYQILADQGVDVVLTPEGALPWLWVGTAGQNANPLYRAIVDRQIPAWVGTAGARLGGETWSLFTILGTGEIIGRYDKVKLVPLGEYIPFKSVLGGLINRLSPMEASMLSGKFNQHFETPFGRAIAGICYDSAFSHLFRSQAAAGGEFIITAANNDPYSSAMMAQHHAQDIMRAIETDRWAARATNTGYSGIVDPHGKTIWRSQVKTYELHADTIYRRQTQTLYVRWGDWLLIMLLGLGAIGLGRAFYVQQISQNLLKSTHQAK
jgi:apolipoprotein N-acyltransferase